MTPHQAEAERMAAELQRMTDLVRYQRAELHEANLITDDEYAQLCSIDGSRVRLETYDDLRDELAEVKKGTLVTWPDGTQSNVPRVELDKWVGRLKETLDKVYGYDTKLNSLQTVVQAIAHLEYDPRRKV